MTRASRAAKKAPEASKEVLSGTKLERSTRSMGTRTTKAEGDESSGNGENKRKSTPISSDKPSNYNENIVISPELDSRGKSRGSSKNASTPNSDAKFTKKVLIGSRQDTSDTKSTKVKSSNKLVESPLSDVKRSNRTTSDSKQESITSFKQQQVKSDTSTPEELSKEPLTTTLFGSIKNFIGKTFMSSSKNDVELNTESIISTESIVSSESIVLTQPLSTADNFQSNNTDFNQMKYKEIQQYVKDNNIKIKQGAKSKKDLIDAIMSFENAKSLNTESPVSSFSSDEIPKDFTIESSFKSNILNDTSNRKNEPVVSVEKYSNELSTGENNLNQTKTSPIEIMKENRKGSTNITATNKRNDSEKLSYIQSANSDKDIDVDPIRNIALDAMTKVKCGDNELSQHEYTAMKLYVDRIKPKELTDLNDVSVDRKNSIEDASSNYLYSLNGVSPYISNESSLQSYYSSTISKTHDVDRRLSYEGGWKSRESFLPSPSLALSEEHRYAASVSKNINTKVLVVPSSGARNNYVAPQPNFMFHNHAIRNSFHNQIATPLMTNDSFTHTPISNPYYGITASKVAPTSVPVFVSPMNTYLPLSSTIGKKRNADVSINQQNVSADYKRPRLPEDIKIQDSIVGHRLSSNLKTTFDTAPNIVSKSIKSLPSTPFNFNVKTLENNTPKSTISFNTDISNMSNTKPSLSFIERRRLLRAKIGKSMPANGPPTGTVKRIIEAISETRNETPSIAPISSSDSKNAINIKNDSNPRLERGVNLSTSSNDFKFTKDVVSNADKLNGSNNSKPSFPPASSSIVPSAPIASFSTAKFGKDDPKPLSLLSSDIAPAGIMKRTESSGKSVSFEVLPSNSTTSNTSVADIFQTSNNNFASNNNKSTPLNKNTFPTAINPPKQVEISNSQGANAKGTSSIRNNDEFEFGSPILIDGVDNNSDYASSSDIKFMFSPPKSHLKQKATPIKTPNNNIQQPQSTTTNINAAPQVQAQNKIATKDVPSTSAAVDLWALAAKSESVKCQNCLVSNAKGATKCASCEAEVCSGCNLLSYDPNDKKCKNSSCKGHVGGNGKQKSIAESSSSSMPDWATQPVKVSTAPTGPFTFGVPASTPLQTAAPGPFTVPTSDAKLSQIGSNNIGFIFGGTASTKEKEGGQISSNTNTSANSANSIAQFTPATANSDPPKISNPTFGVTSSANNSSFKLPATPSLGSAGSAISSTPSSFNFVSSVESTKVVSLPENNAVNFPFKFGTSSIEPTKAVDNIPVSVSSNSSVASMPVPFTVKTEPIIAPMSTLKPVNATPNISVIGPFSSATAKSMESVKEGQTNTTGTVPFVFTGGLTTTQSVSNPVISTSKERTSSHGSESPNSRMDMDGDSPHIVSAALNASSTFVIPQALPTSTTALFSAGVKNPTVPSFQGINSNSSAPSNIFSSSSSSINAFSSTTPANPILFGSSSSQSTALTFGSSLPGHGSQIVPGIAFGNQTTSSLGSTSNQQLLNPSSSNSSISGFVSSSGSNIFSIGTAPKEGERKILKAKKPSRS